MHESAGTECLDGVVVEERTRTGLLALNAGRGLVVRRLHEAKRIGIRPRQWKRSAVCWRYRHSGAKSSLSTHRSGIPPASLMFCPVVLYTTCTTTGMVIRPPDCFANPGSRRGPFVPLWLGLVAVARPTWVVSSGGKFVFFRKATDALLGGNG